MEKNWGGDGTVGDLRDVFVAFDELLKGCVGTGPGMRVVVAGDVLQ